MSIIEKYENKPDIFLVKLLCNYKNKDLDLIQSNELFEIINNCS